MTSAFVSWAVLLSAAHVVEAQTMARLGPRSALSAFRRHLGRRPPSAAAPSAAFAHRRPHRRTAADATARSQVPWNGFRSVSPMNSRPSTTGRFPRSTRPVSASAFESPGGEDGPDESVEWADDSSADSAVVEGLNPSQRESVLRPRYSITRVIAGPGAGKTRVLTCRIARLLLDDDDDDDGEASDHPNDPSGGEDEGANSRFGRGEGVLAVTFTKKAALEMERRLAELLASATRGTGGGEDGGLEEGEFVQHGNADGTAAAADDDISRGIARRATVGTFHSVCSKVLRKFGAELGELPSVRNCVGATNASGATIVQEGDGGRERRTATQYSLDGSFTILDQSDQLRLLKEVLKDMNVELKSPEASSWGGGGASKDIRPITVLNAISLLNAEDAAKMTTAPNGGGDGEEDASSKVGKKVLKIAIEARLPFQRAKYVRNSIDFDDLVLLTRELLLRRPEAREALHRRWRHVLVDEFQDTSRAQLDLVRLWTTDSLFVVGDGDQSIYSWRGASPESMTDFEVAFHGRRHGWEGLLSNGHDVDMSRYLERVCGGSGDRPSDSLLEVKSVYLMENYRSTTNIVKAAQRIISSSSEGGVGGGGDLATSQDGIRRDMKPVRGAGPSPRVLACKDGKAEANFVVKTVNSMIESGDLGPRSTVAMIYRTNAQSRLLEEACVEHGLRYVVKGSSGTFYKRAEIQDCMSFLKVVYNARDRSAWARATKAPSRGIGEASLNEFFRYCDAVAEEVSERGDGAVTPMDVLLSLAPDNDFEGTAVHPKDVMSTRSINRFIPFAASLRSLTRKAEEQSVPDFLLSVIEDLNLKSHFDAISKTKDEYEDRLGNVMELVRAAERYRDDGPCIVPATEDEPMETPLGNFLDDVSLIADLAPDEADTEGDGRLVANLMTIHSSKGMEFDAVCLVGNEDGTFPTQKSVAEGEGSLELSEERRLCYVAMTRAKTNLVLTWRREVSYFAGAGFRTKDGIRSRFLDLLVSKKGEKRTKGPKSSVKGSNVSSRKGAFRSGPAKRELHSAANSYMASEGKSWDQWEPTSQSNPIQNTSVRKSDQRQVIPSRRNTSTGITRGDMRQIVASPRNKSYPSATNTNKRKINVPRAVEQIEQRRRGDIQTKKRSPTPMATSASDGTSLRGEPPPQMDSTVFFPVGSCVKHKFHGRGVVQCPPSTDKEFAEKMLVRVKFPEENGEWDLPMDGLTHTFE